MHDFQKHTAEALPELLKQLKAGGYKVVRCAPRRRCRPSPQYDEELLKDAEAADRELAPGFQRRADDLGIAPARHRPVPALRIEGYVIVSADGMLADARNVMPDELKFEGDKAFFTAALDRADLILHGRNSYEDQPNSPRRKRVILTRNVEAIAPDPSNPESHAVESRGRDLRSGLRAGRRACRHRRDHRRARRVRHVHGPLRRVLALGCAACSATRRRALLSRSSRPHPAGNPGRARNACRASRRCLMQADDVSVTPWRRSA